MLKLPLERPCPKCNVKVNEMCIQSGKTIRGIHAERWTKKKLYEPVRVIEEPIFDGDDRD